MKPQNIALRIAGTIFGLMSIGHIIRFATHAQVVIAGWELPMNISLFGIVLAGGLSLWMWKLSRAESH